METLGKRILGKARRYLLVICLLPVLLGGSGYWIPAGKGEAQQREGEAVITLGSYGLPELNDSKKVIALMSSPRFYKEYTGSVWEEHQGILLKNLSVTPISDQSIRLDLRSLPQKETRVIMHEVQRAFLKLDGQRFQQKQKILTDSIHALEGKTVGPDAKVDQQRFLYELKTEEMSLRPASFLLPDDLGRTAAPGFDSKARAVLGVLIGLTLAFLWIVLPEFVRKV
ncbi:hypothetical protein [Peribacillus sp. SCS-37]|uniref:hypothetical protein n=1 Tax=Paraperibacillus esterisolvens TaxID=3115296 RepID=UPI003906287C